ncbi:MAG: SPOR domain-containing protein [Ramlibacter sp.]|nr:SPOR domain-containing protein [Ramlibacter sp.]
MAFFKFRKAADETAATRQQPESIEAMRKRAKHRLIGAGVLVLVGVVGFPLLFDTQPRPIAVDIPIEIPDRNKAKPLPAPAPAVAQAPVASGTVSVASAPVKEAPPAAPEKVAAAPAAVVPPPAKAEPAPPAKPESRPEPKVEAKPTPKPDDGAKAKALLEGKAVEPASAAGKGRFVVQVGAFADADKAREARLKVEKSGLKTYTQVADTADGKRTRVRVGPFGTKAEAEQAADKIKGLDLPANILTL